jgi:hypothetical protein
MSEKPSDLFLEGAVIVKVGYSYLAIPRGHVNKPLTEALAFATPVDSDHERHGYKLMQTPPRLCLEYDSKVYLAGPKVGKVDDGDDDIPY